MSDILDKIAAYKRDEIAAAKERIGERDMMKRAEQAEKPRGFFKALADKTARGETALICEIKKASPSKGTIRSDFDVPALAKAYEKGGATCLSVLTDAPSFQGRLEDLESARAAMPLPCLRKDFLFDPYQVFEARAFGADCILIILAAVSDGEAEELENAAFGLDMDVLLEVHNRPELERALALRSKLLGINNRDLKTFETDPGTTRELAALVKDEEYVIVSESGFRNRDQLADMGAFGVNAFLIGESLMRQEDVSAATRALL